VGRYPRTARDTDRAFDVFGKGVPAYMAAICKLNQVMDPLRTDPRSSRLLNRLGPGGEKRSVFPVAAGAAPTESSNGSPDGKANLSQSFQ